MNPFCSRAWANVSVPPGTAAPSSQADLQAAQVVRGALALAAPGERHDRPVARPRQLLELGLGLLDPARGDVGGLGAELERLVLVDARQADPCAALELGRDLVGADVQVVGVLVVEGGAHVLPVVGQRGCDVLLPGDQHAGVRGRELEERMEVLDRQQLGDVGPVGLLLERGDLRQLAVLLGELGRRGDLDELGVAQRTLRERREPPQRLDLVAEQVDAHGAVLGRGKHVEQAAADRELAAIFDLIDPLVAGRNELHGDLVEVEELAGLQAERVRAKRRVGNLLRQRHGADDDHRSRAFACFEQRVERRDPQTDEVRRWRQVRLVGDAAAGVIADGARLEPGSQARGEVARGAVVAGDDDRRVVRIAVQEGGDQVRAQCLGDEATTALARERVGLRVVVCMGEKGAEHLPTESRKVAPRRG